jgi:5-(carboxyamino)imidazole ribonucleotide synthase
LQIAILGCGQLARMLAQAARPLGISCNFAAIAGEGTSCVDGLGKVVAWDAGDVAASSAETLYRALGSPAVITVERESIDVELLRALQVHCRVYPDPDSVHYCQNRRLERRLLAATDIPCSPHREAFCAADVVRGAELLGLPLVVKSAESGYDGKHQWRLRSAADIEAFCASYPRGDWLLEQWVDFTREVSVVAVRSAQGEFRAYPVTENIHEDGILHVSIVPCRKVSQGLQQLAIDYSARIMQELGYVGVMAVEYFVLQDQVWVNEMAPRVHNSGHWTMLPVVASQFENHVRAICDLPLGSTTPAAASSHLGMVNILGEPAGFAAWGGMQVHDYNKSPRPGRKLGHVNVQASNEADLMRQLEEIYRKLYRHGLPASAKNSWLPQAKPDRMKRK